MRADWSEVETLFAHRDTGRETSLLIRLIYRRPGAVGELMLGNAWRVRPADALLKPLRQLLGAESVRISYKRPVYQDLGAVDGVRDRHPPCGGSLHAKCRA
ncbi:hypothetical protein [Allochromatium palmeri]|uniref:hypothetical protein n=1 Tax=Allochromatium palmeri TaxID=231048 RepID=UPI003CCE33CE